MYIVLGLVTTLAVMLACAAVLDTLAHQLIEISQFGYSSYVSIQEFRYEYAQYRYDSPARCTHHSVAFARWRPCVPWAHVTRESAPNDISIG